jgi:FkbM family methyltransferase
MIVTTILNSLHRKRYFKLLSWICSIGYLLKGRGWVEVKYRPQSRAYLFRVRGITYMSLGPGWAYSFDYLKNQVMNTFCHFYIPKRGDCVVDLGAGLGEEALVIAQLVESSGSVYAIEANPFTFDGLEYACKTNRFDWVKAVNLAIFNKNGMVSIEDNDENYLGNTINMTDNKSIQVNALTFDSFIGSYQIKNIDFLKVNIEGAEQFLIEGMEKSIHLIKNVCISCHDFRHNFHQEDKFYVTKEKVKSFLTANGFEILKRDPTDPLIDDYVYATNTKLRM